MADKKVDTFRKLKERFVTLVTGAFGFVAALQWNNAILEWLKPVTTQGANAVALTWVAIAVTVLAVLATVLIGKFSE